MLASDVSGVLGARLLEHSREGWEHLEISKWRSGTSSELHGPVSVAGDAPGQVVFLFDLAQCPDCYQDKLRVNNDIQDHR